MESRGRPAKYPNTKGIAPQHVGRKCLALDLDETLVHSSFQPVPQAHYVIPVTIEGIVHNVFVIKRPGMLLIVYFNSHDWFFMLLVCKLQYFHRS